MTWSAYLALSWLLWNSFALAFRAKSELYSDRFNTVFALGWVTPPTALLWIGGAFR